MILGSSEWLEKKGQLLPLCLEEPSLSFKEVPDSAGRISWLGFGQDPIGCGGLLLLPNARVKLQCPILCSCARGGSAGCGESGMFRAAGNGLILLPAQSLGLLRVRKSLDKGGWLPTAPGQG